MTRIAIIGLGLLALAACEPVAPGGSSATPLKCDDSYQVLVGRNVAELNLPQGLAHRIITPGMAVTEDFNADRLNVHVDAKGWITKVECW